MREIRVHFHPPREWCVSETKNRQTNKTFNRRSKYAVFQLILRAGLSWTEEKVGSSEQERGAHTSEKTTWFKTFY
jgi:hypothetical protein